MDAQLKARLDGAVFDDLSLKGELLSLITSLEERATLSEANMQPAELVAYDPAHVRSVLAELYPNAKTPPQ